MVDNYQMPQKVNGEQFFSNGSQKPLLELYVKASGIDSKRIGACLFCQEFWMELYALYEIGLVRVEVKTVNVNSEAFKGSFLGAQPPIMIENKTYFSRQDSITYTDNREIEGRIFHLTKEFNVPLFEKDQIVEKKIESLYRNFKLFLRAKVEHDKNGTQMETRSAVSLTCNKVVEQLTSIDQLLSERSCRYLLGNSMTEYDCELLPRLHHMRICGQYLLEFDIPHNLTHLWNYILTGYRTAAFIESCPADQDITHHYKEQMSMYKHQRESLQTPTKTHTIPDDVLVDIKRLGLNSD